MKARKVSHTFQASSGGCPRTRIRLFRAVAGVLICVVGLAVGAGLRLYVTKSQSQSGISSVSIQKHIEINDDFSVSLLAGEKPRPKLEDVLRARDSNLVAIAARFLIAADRDEVSALADAWKFEVNDNVTAYAWKLLLARMTEFDPDIALNMAVKLRKLPRQPYLEAFVYDTWAAKDLTGAVLRAQQMPDPRLRWIIKQVVRQDIALALELVEQNPDNTLLRAAMTEEWAKTNPQAALEAASELPGTLRRQKAVARVLGAWGEHDPDGALAQIDLLELTKSQRIMIRCSVIGDILKKHPNHAEEALSSMNPGRVRYELLKRLAYRRLKDGARNALNWARGLAPGPERSAALAIAGRAWADGSTDRLQSFFEEIGLENVRPNPADNYDNHPGIIRTSSDGSLDSLHRELLADLAQADPRKAMGLAIKAPYGDGGWTDPMSEVKRAWFKSDPVGYLEWLNKEAPDMGTDFLARGLPLRGMDSDTLDLVMETASNLEYPRLRFGVELDLVSYLCETDLHRAVEYADQLGPESRESMLSIVLTSMREFEPEMAIRYLDKVEAFGNIRERIVKDILQSLPYRGAKRARRLFDSLPAPERAEFAHSKLTEAYIQESMLTASEFVKSLPPGNNFDAAAETLVHSLADNIQGSDFEATLLWAQSIGDTDRRENSLKLVYRSMLEHNRAFGEKALRSSSLPESMKQSLLAEKE